MQVIGGVVGIGSLPFSDPEAAMDFVSLHTPRIPYWPQLPRRTVRELMMHQLLCGLDDVFDLEKTILDSRKDDEEVAAALRRAPLLDERHAAGWQLFLKALEAGEFPQAAAVKGQLIGPATAALSISVRGRVIANSKALLAALVERVEAFALWQLEQLRPHHRRVIVQLDEPLLREAEPHLVGATHRLIRRLRNEGAVTMLHHCGRPDASFFRSGAEILSLDWERNRARGDELSTLLKGREPGSHLMRSPADEDAALEREIGQSWLVGPPCGLAFLDVEERVAVEKATAIIRQCDSKARLLGERENTGSPASEST